ncbi:MAG: hypothetical protein JJU28_01985 [Cyclobacteriaceae bacterium]|nr:hypothetical protein [Cyclobacteriaceae bacterium]
MSDYFNLEFWNLWGRMASYVLFAITAFILIYYYIKLSSLGEYKKKYDYINRNEINYLWAASITLLIALGIFINTLVIGGELVWIAVRAFVTIMMGLIIGVIISNLLKFYYPFYVEKRLKKLRYTPRISPKSGKPMKLLTEDEEDVYLDEGMQAEENVFSVDYDVWIDEETGYTKIEKYAGHLIALQCPECNYQTLKVVKEEIIDSPTTNEEGELMKFYKCDYCGYKERKAFRIAKLKAPQDEGITSS